MKITLVHFSALVNTGNYENEKIGMDAQVEEGDTVEEVVEALKDRVFGLLDRADYLQRHRKLREEISDLTEQAKEAQEQWEQARAFLIAQGLRPDAPEFPVFVTRGRAIAAAAEPQSERIEVRQEDVIDEDRR
jgi:vacuolar-type H+-ATPase subunit I/STV1